jgi:peptidyl-prolyl cis-trans isomerase D
MLDKIRENSRSIGTYIVFGILIVVFIAYFGPGSSGCVGMGGNQAAPANYAARVNGEEVPLRAFRESYDRMYRMYGAQMGGRMTPEMADQLHLKDTVLDGMVDRTLLLQAARQMGLKVTDEDLSAELRKIPSFQKNGHFDFETYKTTLSNMGTTPDVFEDGIREDLLRQRYLSQLRLSAVVSDQEIQDQFGRDNDRAKLAWVRFPVGEYTKSVQVTPQEVQAYLADPEGKAKVEAEYDRTKSVRFEKPQRIAAQHILIKVAEDAPPADVEAAKKKLEAAQKRIAGGEDFGKVAAEVSEDDSSKVKGGDLGTFGPGTMVKPFEEAAMALKAGQISEPVRSQFGWHLIKVNQVIPAESTPRDEALQTVARELLVEKKAEALALQKANEALAAARAGGKKLEDMFPKAPAGDPMSRPVGVFSGETQSFQARSQYIPSMGVVPEISADLATATQPGQLLPRAYPLNGEVFIAQVVERQLPDPAELEKRKDEIRQQLEGQKEDKLIQAFTKQMREGAKVEKNPMLTSGAEAPADAG